MHFFISVFCFLTPCSLFLLKLRFLSPDSIYTGSFSCFLYQSLNFFVFLSLLYRGSPAIFVFLSKNKKASIFATTPVDVVLMCFVFSKSFDFCLKIGISAIFYVLRFLPWFLWKTSRPQMNTSSFCCFISQSLNIFVFLSLLCRCFLLVFLHFGFRSAFSFSSFCICMHFFISVFCFSLHVHCFF